MWKVGQCGRSRLTGFEKVFQSLQFLKKVDLLEQELQKETADVLLKGLEYVQAFRAFLTVVKGIYQIS